jgi:hypothetical protein
MHPDFFNFIDGQAGIEALVQSRFQSIHITVGAKRRYRDDALLSLAQCVKLFHFIFLRTDYSNPMEANQEPICATVSLSPLLYTPKPFVTVEFEHILAISFSNKPTPPPPWV